MRTMTKAAVFVAPGHIELADKPIPDVGPNDALVRITTTILRHRHPHPQGRVSGGPGPDHWPRIGGSD